MVQTLCKIFLLSSCLLRIQHVLSVCLVCCWTFPAPIKCQMFGFSPFTHSPSPPDTGLPRNNSVYFKTKIDLVWPKLQPSKRSPRTKYPSHFQQVLPSQESFRRLVFYFEKDHPRSAFAVLCKSFVVHSLVPLDLANSAMQGIPIATNISAPIKGRPCFWLHLKSMQILSNKFVLKPKGCNKFCFETNRLKMFFFETKRFWIKQATNRLLEVVKVGSDPSRAL